MREATMAPQGGSAPKMFVQAASAESGGGCPVKHEAAGGGPGGGCPVDHGSSEGVAAGNMMPLARELQASTSAPSGGGKAVTDKEAERLSTNRVKSSIPIGSQSLPQHQVGDSPNWTYPSERMFYNAMKRKGWDPDSGDMRSVVMIHNAVNERAWREILEWEAARPWGQCGDPKLVRFQGRPKDYSPKARMLNWMGYKLPFDRHDWYVDRCGTTVRYVIDFYNAAPAPGQPVAMHLDVRPALDDPVSLVDRVLRQAQWVASGAWMGGRDPTPSPS